MVLNELEGAVLGGQVLAIIGRSLGPLGVRNEGNRQEWVEKVWC